MGSTDERKGKERPEQDIVTFPETAEMEKLAVVQTWSPRCRR